MSVADFLSWISRWMVHQNTLNHCPTVCYVCRQFVNIQAFEIFLNVGKLTHACDPNWQTNIDRIKVYSSIWQTGWIRWTTNRIWIALKIYLLLVNKQWQGGRPHASDFFVNKWKECGSGDDYSAISKCASSCYQQAVKIKLCP